MPTPPHTRKPLTAEQIAFLRSSVRVLDTQAADGVWMATTWCTTTVFEVALLVVHMVDNESRTVSRLRTQIEAVVGPLPLAMDPEDLKAIRYQPLSENGHSFEMT